MPLAAPRVSSATTAGTTEAFRWQRTTGDVEILWRSKHCVEAFHQLFAAPSSTVFSKRKFSTTRGTIIIRARWRDFVCTISHSTMRKNLTGPERGPMYTDLSRSQKTEPDQEFIIGGEL